MSTSTSISTKGEWQCVRTLGRGSFGVVELWKNSKSSEMNAIKRFDVKSPEQTSDKIVEEYKKLWKKEVELMTTMERCPFIVSAGTMPQELSNLGPSLFMEYCSGGNLRTVLKLPENICGLQEPEALSVLDHLSKAILFLHKMGIVHRDLKPDNILRCLEPGDRDRVTYKLSDLGLAKDISKKKECNTFVGTPQYLAPEIYMGKPYDKTVDYWSFGIIAFEILCGVRPFLHGESPASWLPLVEQKAKDVICIYRNSEGKIILSNSIPFHNHLSEAKKECLIVWLRTMLQLDPARRGHKITVNTCNNNSQSPPPPSSEEEVGLKLLSSTLSTKFLEIFALKERLSFPVGLGTTIRVQDVQQRVLNKTGISQDKQLILTIDGTEVSKDENEAASKYIDKDLFLIPLNRDNLRLKVRFPTLVNNFILSWDSVKDPARLRKVWASSIHYIQSELQKVEICKKSAEALKIWWYQTYATQIKRLEIDIEKAGSSLGTLLELEGRLEAIDGGLNAKDANCEGKGSQALTNEMADLYSCYRTVFDSWVENVPLKAVSTTELEELYHRILRGCSEWRSSDITSPPFSFNEILVRNVCRFIVKVNQVDEWLTHNIRVHLDKIQSDRKMIDEMKAILQKIEDLTLTLVQERCRKQTLLIHKLNGTELPSIIEKENTPPRNGNTPTTNDNKYVRGGGKGTVRVSTMSQSASVADRGRSGAGAGCSNDPPTMSVSLNTGLKTSSHCPLVTKLLQESKMLKSRTEEAIGNLNGSLEEIQDIVKERESIQWDFLN